MAWGLLHHGIAGIRTTLTDKKQQSARKGRQLFHYFYFIHSISSKLFTIYLFSLKTCLSLSYAVFRKRHSWRLWQACGLRNTLAVSTSFTLDSSKWVELCTSLNINTPIFMEDVAIKRYERRYLSLNVKYLQILLWFLCLFISLFFINLYWVFSLYLLKRDFF